MQPIELDRRSTSYKLIFRPINYLPDLGASVSRLVGNGRPHTDRRP